MRLLPTLLCLGLLVGPPAGAQPLVKRVTIPADARYLNLPVRQSNGLSKARIVVDGRVLDEFTLKLTDQAPDFWTFFDVSRYRGKHLTLEVDSVGGAVADLKLVQVADTFPGQGALYGEKYRPQATFSSRRGWHNDPNGLVYQGGEYHLFYQHNPYGWEWGNMHWGHAVSRDLVHWRELPDALYSPDHAHMAFSGSAVVDTGNTSGLRKGGVSPLVAFYTRTGRGESMAVSYDGGRTFEDRADDPVVKHEGRDPKVFWYAPGKHWVMVAYDESQTRALGLGQNAIVYRNAIYTSPDLTHWTYQSSVAGFFECPELFELGVEGQPGVRKWVMYDGSGSYVVGDFDGRRFTPEQTFRHYDYGHAFYASQTYNNVPARDGRRVQIGWFRGGHFEGMPFNQKMTFPTSLKLRRSFDGYRLTPTPVAEIASLHARTHTFTDKVVVGDSAFRSPVTGDVLHVIAEIDPGDAPVVGLDVNGYRLAYDRFSKTLNGVGYVPPSPDNLKIELIVDRVGVEAFVNDGDLYFVDALNSVDAARKLEVFATGGPGRKAILKSLTVHELGSIWDRPGVRAPSPAARAQRSAAASPP